MSLRKQLKRQQDAPEHALEHALFSHLEEWQADNEEVFDSLAPALLDKLTGTSRRATGGDEVAG